MFTFLSLLPLALWMWAAHAGRRQPAVALVVYLSMIGANVLLIVSGSLVLLASFASGRPLLALQNTALTPDDLAFLGRTLLLGGLAATLVMVPFIQRGLARFMDIRPKDPVHTTALVMAARASLALSGPAAADGVAVARAYDRIDRNDDGRIGPVERHRARYLYKRTDLNDDGRIGPRERHFAREVRRHADYNGDGRLGPRERRHTRRVLNQADRHIGPGRH